MHPTRPLRGATLAALVLGCALLAACGAFVPATPGHEPPGDGPYNPVSHEDNEGK